jgi:creatinine amidohydrolase
VNAAPSEPTAELRYERLHPAELRRVVEQAPLAFVPVGTLEFHGEHLPFGVDLFEAHTLCLRAAALCGGVVLPPVYLACGCLDLPFTLSFDRELVHAWVRATIDQLALRGFKAVVVVTGHGPLDLNHLLKRACAEAEADHPGLAAYGLCWLELNAARLSEPQTGEPTVVDHAALVETSWMLALEPELVHVDRLSDDPEAAQLGIYGRNPRFTASADLGEDQLAAGAELLARRAADLLAGRPLDVFADLRAFVQYGWPERPLLRGHAGSPARLFVTNPGRSSRYLSALQLELDGSSIDASSLVLVNESPGETATPVRASELGPENGFYLRRGQEATISLDGVVLSPGMHRVHAELGLGGVTSLVLDEDVEFIS